MKVIIHKQIYRKGVMDSMVNTTLCGRMSVQDAGTHIGLKITCKLCLKRIKARREP
jgi:hypothetical protein